MQVANGCDWWILDDHQRGAVFTQSLENGVMNTIAHDASINIGN